MNPQFADDPAEYFGFDAWEAHQHPRAEVEALQLAALQGRFSDLKDKITPLGAMAHVQGIDEIRALEDVVPLLFPHNIYKAYSEDLVLEKNFRALTKWLSRLTTNDLSAVADIGFETMDDWMDAIDDQTNLEICHSSGTSGRLSFYPRGKQEVKQQYTITQMKFTERNWGRQFTFGDWPFAIVWPAQAFGRTSILRGADLLRNLVTEDPSDFYPFLPMALSSDHHHYVMRCQKLLSEGVQEAPAPSDYVQMRLAEAEAVYKDVPLLQERILDTVAMLKYKKRIMLFGTPIIIHNFATAGLQRGMENMLMEDSFINTVGGFKNNPASENLLDDVKRFAGPGTLYKDAYGMTELITGFDHCDFERFHIPPWIIPFLIDIDTGEVLPREGVQQGRGAFFDLPVQTYWGGTVTADNIEIDWGDCPCKRKTPTIGPVIERMAESSKELYIGTSDPKAIDAAIESLNAGLPHEVIA
ncbi:hypothetical protein [Fretibacter rubidus]|uniref:hypothetical protein n=1 Tax=Fretibacter rubidus TaxID=570162 RepID=UPI00352A75E0